VCASKSTELQRRGHKEDAESRVPSYSNAPTPTVIIGDKRRFPLDCD
jgi:hypothetical protein